LIHFGTRERIQNLEFRSQIKPLIFDDWR